MRSCWLTHKGPLPTFAVKADDRGQVAVLLAKWRQMIDGLKMSEHFYQGIVAAPLVLNLSRQGSPVCAC